VKDCLYAVPIAIAQALHFFSLMKKTKQKKSRLRSQPSFFSNVAKLKELTAFKQLSILTLLAWEKLKNIHKAEIKLKPFRPFF
jgi:hypothetical protein